MSKAVFSSMCRRCRTNLIKTQQRTFSCSIQRRAEPTSQQTTTPQRAPAASAAIRQIARNAANESRMAPSATVSPDEPYHLNVFTHKHNIHITFTAPDRDVILSYSAGNIGLRKSHRGTFDAAYQLAAYTFRKIAEKNWKIGGKKAIGTPITLNDSTVRQRGIEVVLRGYGEGREAFQKAILGAEGRIVKGLVKKVTDGTRLKFGGVRSRAVRRL